MPFMNQTKDFRLLKSEPSYFIVMMIAFRDKYETERYKTGLLK